MKILKKGFYKQDTLKVAKELLGCVLCRQIGGILYKGKIVETEGYTQEDPACHAYRGVTKRSSTMFEEGGIAYIYFTYGMYHCMNVVTEKQGRGCAVLIRAVEPLSGNFSNTNGPAKLCRELSITRTLNGIDITKKGELWIEERFENPKKIITTTRVGIKDAVDYPWRFYISDNKWVSKK